MKKTQTITDELESELAKREKIHAELIRMYSSQSHHTRAKFTTLNARIQAINERLEWLRSEIKKGNL